MVAAGLVEYIDFPQALVGKYQCLTAGRSRATARRRLRPRVRRCRERRRALCGGAESARALTRPIFRCSTDSSPRPRRCSFATAAVAVEVNKATQAELESVKGIGLAVSTQILAERQKGEFKDWNDLVRRVKGIGAGRAAKFSAAGLTVHGKPLRERRRRRKPGPEVAAQDAAPAGSRASSQAKNARTSSRRAIVSLTPSAISSRV